MYMIRLLPKTMLEEMNQQLEDFPKYTFFLTPFTELPQLEGNNEYFIGTIVSLLFSISKMTIKKDSDKLTFLLTIIFRCYWTNYSSF